ncbi:TetR/AcrR family transcriptional regulator [Sphingopyxis kveilinensis]|uniref:TetR/AcrR family transcriptional regulator n=1 Tax=Sphingopyxis kveilinensis TaxID=3114367 RepID=UPI0030D39E2A
MIAPYIEESTISRVITVINNEPAGPRTRGRPRAFDRDRALETAARTFWQHGYEGTSIATLTAAMGITPQSLYAAFRSKAVLYGETLHWYQQWIGAATAAALQDADVIAGFTRILRDSAREFCRSDQPRGCMISTALLNCGSDNDPVAATTTQLRGATLSAFRDRLQRGVDDGALRADTDVEALARFLGALIQGMSVQARDGATAAELVKIADMGVAELHRHRAG